MIEFTQNPSKGMIDLFSKKIKNGKLEHWFYFQENFVKLVRLTKS
jgi:hypothetical protein